MFPAARHILGLEIAHLIDIYFEKANVSLQYKSAFDLEAMWRQELLRQDIGLIPHWLEPSLPHAGCRSDGAVSGARRAAKIRP